MKIEFEEPQPQLTHAGDVRSGEVVRTCIDRLLMGLGEQAVGGFAREFVNLATGERCTLVSGTEVELVDVHVVVLAPPHAAAAERGG